MDLTYLLHIKGETLPILRTKSQVTTESEFINLLTKASSKSHLDLISIQINFLFEKLDSKCHQSSNWLDNFKTLLSHGFDVIGPDYKFLKKSFQSVQFKLHYGENQNIHYGYFHKQTKENVADCFIRFCKATEYPCGINEHIISQALVNESGALMAIVDYNVRTLVQINKLTGVLHGEEVVIQFLMGSTDTLNKVNFGSAS